MATEPTITRPDSETDVEVPKRFQTPASATEEIDSELVDKTKVQIRKLVSEIAESAKSDIPINEFFEGFLNRTTSALASAGGAIWLKNKDDGKNELEYHINVNQTCLATDTTAQIQHSLLLAKAMETGTPQLVPPHSGSGSPSDAGNPTEHLLIFGPLIIDQDVVGLVEIFQRAGAGPTTQRGYLRFLTQMSEIASDFLRNHRLRSFSDQQHLWQQLEQFIRTVHQGLDTEQTVYMIANEGRRIIGCDRVSVALNSGKRSHIKAVSGLDSIERRADQVKKLGALVSTVTRAGEPLWYSGNDSELPPQIERKLQEYVDQSHTKMLAVIPLNRVDVKANDLDAESTESANEPIGAIVIEQLKDSRVEPAMRKRVEVIVDHGQTALTNAIDHNGIFMMPVWRALGKITAPFSASQLPRTLAIAGCIGAVIAFFCLFPHTFNLGAKGQLIPESQYEIFAPIDGILESIHINEENESIVERNQLLAEMTNNDLDSEIQALRGQLSTTREEIRLHETTPTQQLSTMDKFNSERLLMQARESEKSLKRELEIKKSDQALLKIHSPARGRVVNWKVRQNLLLRPVDRGQALMTIIDPNTQWQIELQIPEKRLGHLMSFVNRTETQPEVLFALASHPGREFAGRLVTIDQKLEVYSDDGNAALATIEFDNDQIPSDLFRSGTRVNAKINCGSASIGYVWFHELIETVHTTAKFWF